MAVTELVKMCWAWRSEAVIRDWGYTNILKKSSIREIFATEK